MTECPLYAESGAKKRKMQVHVLALLGCISQGETTEAALEAMPDSTRDYIRTAGSTSPNNPPPGVAFAAKFVTLSGAKGLGL